MKNIVFFGIAIRIIILFSTGFLISFANPWLHSFFGDVQSTSCNIGDVDRCWHWHTSHYWYAWCMFFLFLLSIINCIISIVNIIEKNYNTKILE